MDEELLKTGLSSAGQDESEDVEEQDEGTDSQNAQQKNAARLQRKRTKTGCLTCRKRRIKCGEERPTCANCIKSKRNCEGYNQRVVFKNPIGGFHGPGQGYGPRAIPSLPTGYASQMATSNPNLLPIAPKTMLNPAPVPGNMPYLGHAGYFSHPQKYDQQTALQPLPIPQPTIGYSYHLSAGQIPQPGIERPMDLSRQRHMPPFQGDHTPLSRAQDEHVRYSAAEGPQPYQHIVWSEAGTVAKPDPEPSTSMPHQRSVSPEKWQKVTPLDQSAYSGYTMVDDSTGWHAPYNTAKDDYRTSRASLYDDYDASMHDNVQRYSVDSQLPNPNDSQPPLKPSAEERGDDEDPWDVMDEDMDDLPAEAVSVENLGLLTRMNADTAGLHVRSYTTFLNDSNVLAQYRPTYASSPLNDEKTARIFAHFLSGTGQSISIYERNFSNTTAIFSGTRVPPSQQGLWTYTLPALALENSHLMHSILALGALHIANLQETPRDPAVKHLRYAMRRVGKLIGLPTRRNEIATLTANLCLGFYEVMSAEHAKWNIHLTGAKILLMETDFAGMTKAIRDMRNHAKTLIAGMSPPPDMTWRDIWSHTGYSDELLDPKDWEIDDMLVSEFSGMHVRFSSPSEGPKQQDRVITEKDIQDYKTRSDLFWWYCKQDLFQSMVSGNDLLMPYEHWVSNPPRAQFGRHDAAYGTFDHLVLLMARLCDFAARDRPRKMKVMAANGGQWKPPPGFFPSGKPPPRGAAGPPGGRGPPPPGSMGPPSGAGGARPTMPTFHGMMPPKPGPVQMSSDYAIVSTNLREPYGTPQSNTSLGSNERSQPSSRYISPDVADAGGPTPSRSNSDASSSMKSDMDAATQEALSEHAAISRAFDLLFSSLPSAFAPLSPAQSPPIATPFGPAMQYRTHVVACIHVLYQCGLLLLSRMHPHMPPAAMAATVISASKTAGTAQIMGRICGGLYSTLDYTTARMSTPKYGEFSASSSSMPGMDSTTRGGNMNPALGAALMETTFPLFFAAVQYTDATQRAWTVSRLKLIAKCTGWQTSAAVAAGCEAAWQKMGMGQGGPPQGPPSTPGVPQNVPGPLNSQEGSISNGASNPSRSGSSSIHSSDRFPVYVPTVNRNDLDRRVEGLWRDRDKIIRAQQSQKQTPNEITSYINSRPLGRLWSSQSTITDPSNETHPFLHHEDRSLINNKNTSSSYPDQSNPTTEILPTLIPDPGRDENELPIDEDTPAPINSDRRFIASNPAARVHWALGILGVEKDMKELSLGNEKT